MNILAIETSCDDTCVAIIKTPSKKGGNFNVLSNIVSSQVKIHQKYGGVYPTLAKREHQKNLVTVLSKALMKSGLLKKIEGKKWGAKSKTLKEILSREESLFENLKKFLEKNQKPKIDVIAVTIGPGLEPCLWVGVNFAKALSFYWGIPIIAVNHIKAHLFVNMLQNGKLKELTKKDFPAVCLIVSGGHTQLILMKDFGKYKALGETRDDAAGECFDKTARILGLSYPGGPVISRKAAKLQPSTQIKNLSALANRIHLPRPMINTKDYDFSFSGLKTAVLYEFKKQPKKTRESQKYIKQMCAEIQQAIIDVLIKKTIKAAKDYNAKTIILGGGVVANEELRRQFKSKVGSLGFKINLLIPPKDLCTDNALMVALAGYFRVKSSKTENWKSIAVNANLGLQ